jgi:hypothetical protein
MEPEHLSTHVVSPWDDGEVDPATLVEATVRLRVGTFFGRYVGLNSIDLTRRAVAESAPGTMAIFAKDTSCEAVGLRFNGQDIDITGDVHSNGSFTANGEDIHADSATARDCLPAYPDISGPNIGWRTNRMPDLHNTDVEWPQWFDQGTFACDFTGTDIIINAVNITPGTYCASKEIKVEQDGAKGNVTFLAPKISLKKGHDFTARQQGVVIFATDVEEMVLNTDNSTFRGILFHPGGAATPDSPCPPKPKGRIVVNGFDNTIIGMVEACEVHLNGEGFNVVGGGGARQLALRQ